MLTNIVGGLQGIVDHVLVGHLVGYTGNAAIGVSWQIILVVIVFISSLFTGMGVLVARFAGAGDSDKVDRVVYQAFLTAIFLSLRVMAPMGYFASPWLLDFVNAAPAVKAEALPFLRIMFLFSQRHDGVLHAGRGAAVGRRRTDADDPRHRADGAEPGVQRRADPRPRADSRRSARRLCHGHGDRVGSCCVYALWKLVERQRGWCRFRAATGCGSRLAHHPIAVPVRTCRRASRALR